MGSSIKVRTSIREGIATVRTIIRHPMHTGFEIDATTGEIIPAHYIETVTVRHVDKTIMQCDWSRAVSTNPYLSFAFSGARAGDPLSISWKDNKNGSDSVEVKIE